MVRLSDLPFLQTNINNNMEKEEEKKAPEGGAENSGNATLALENERLKAQVKELERKETEARSAEATQLLDEAVRSGRITAQARPQFEKLFEVDHESAKAALAALPERKPLQTSNTGGSHDDRSDWTYLDWMKKDSEGLRRMKTEEPERFKELQQTINKKN